MIRTEEKWNIVVISIRSTASGNFLSECVRKSEENKKKIKRRIFFLESLKNMTSFKDGKILW